MTPEFFQELNDIFRQVFVDIKVRGYFFYNLPHGFAAVQLLPYHYPDFIDRKVVARPWIEQNGFGAKFSPGNVLVPLWNTLKSNFLKDHPFPLWEEFVILF
jgi:hypothetical protein